MTADEIATRGSNVGASARTLNCSTSNISKFSDTADQGDSKLNSQSNQAKEDSRVSSIQSKTSQKRKSTGQITQTMPISRAKKRKTSKVWFIKIV